MTVFRLLMHTIKPWGSPGTFPPNLGKLLRNRFTIHAAMPALVWYINHSEGELSSLGFAHIREKRVPIYLKSLITCDLYMHTQCWLKQTIVGRVHVTGNLGASSAQRLICARK